MLTRNMVPLTEPRYCQGHDTTLTQTDLDLRPR
jgi:hypothetical protein